MQGEVVDQGTLEGEYCVLYAFDGCAIVWGIDLFTGSSGRKLTLTGKDVNAFLDRATSTCANQGPVAVIGDWSDRPDDQPFGYDMSLCVVNVDSVASCGTAEGAASP